jgi:hypothetical protein
MATSLACLPNMSRGSCHSIFCLPHLRAPRHLGSRVTRANCLSLRPVSMSYFARRCWNISTVLRFRQPVLTQACHTSDGDRRSAVRAGPSHRRTTCRSWATQSTIRHVNRFTLGRLSTLFQPLRPVNVSYAGATREATNWLATLLMDLAGNPWGTYDQAEPCIHCQSPLTPPRQRSLPERFLSKGAATLNRIQTRFRASFLCGCVCPSNYLQAGRACSRDPHAGWLACSEPRDGRLRPRPDRASWAHRDRSALGRRGGLARTTRLMPSHIGSMN